MRIQSIDFKREKGGKTEKGLLIETWDDSKNETNFIMVDAMSNPIVGLVWDYAVNYDLMIGYME